MAQDSKKKEIATYKNQLKTFMRHNPTSKVERIGKQLYVTQPWDDNSLAFVLKPDSAPYLIDALTHLILPPRLTAIYHRDTNTVEYIYDVLEEEDPCFNRHFHFILDGKTYGCRFAKTSERLLTLAKCFRRIRQSRTNFRNLVPLRDYVGWGRKTRQSLEDTYMGMEPISFYISGFKGYDEAEMIDVSKHVNFFAMYYDRDCPYIIIHQVLAEGLQKPVQLQFIETTFPEAISTRSHDPFLLDLALEASRVGTRLRFIYHFQILEYAAFYYVDDDIRRQLLAIISAPDIHAKPNAYVSRILETLGSSLRQEEEAKIQKVVKLACDPEAVWKELQENLPYFTKEHEFDGGFLLEPLIAEDTSLETFSTMWHPKTADTLRFIRNALVHAREKKHGAVISPTPRNDVLLSPWANVIRRIAEQVIIYGRAAQA